MNTCQCVNPPGGTASCDDNQLAICVVEYGVAHAFCVTMPRDALSALRADRDVAAYLARFWPAELPAVRDSLTRNTIIAFRPESSATSMANFILAIIKGEPRDHDQNISREDRSLLDRGEHRMGNRVIRFRIPPEEGDIVKLLRRPEEEGIGGAAVEQPIKERVATV